MDPKPMLPGQPLQHPWDSVSQCGMIGGRIKHTTQTDQEGQKKKGQRQPPFESLLKSSRAEAPVLPFLRPLVARCPKKNRCEANKYRVPSPVKLVHQGKGPARDCREHRNPKPESNRRKKRHDNIRIAG